MRIDTRSMAGRYCSRLNRMAVIIFLVSGALALTFKPGIAKELVGIRISGPGIQGQLAFSDAETVRLFRELETREFLTVEPKGLSGFVFEINMEVGAGKNVVASNVYHYRPPADGSAGYLYFGEVINGWSSAEKMWFPLSVRSDLALREFLAAHGGSSALVGRPNQPQPGALLPSNFAAWLVAGLVITASVGAAWADREALKKG